MIFWICGLLSIYIFATVLSYILFISNKNKDCCYMEIRYGIYNEHPSILKERRGVVIIYSIISALIIAVCLHILIPAPESDLYEDYLWKTVPIFGTGMLIASHISMSYFKCLNFQIAALIFAIVSVVDKYTHLISNVPLSNYLIYAIVLIVSLILSNIFISRYRDNILLSSKYKIKQTTLYPWPKWDMSEEESHKVAQQIFDKSIPKKFDNIEEFLSDKYINVNEKEFRIEVNDKMHIIRVGKKFRSYDISGPVFVLNIFSLSRDASRYDHTEDHFGYIEDIYIKYTEYKSITIYATKDKQIYIGRTSYGGAVETLVKAKENDKSYEYYKEELEQIKDIWHLWEEMHAEEYEIAKIYQKEYYRTYSGTEPSLSPGWWKEYSQRKIKSTPQRVNIHYQKDGKDYILTRNKTPEGIWEYNMKEVEKQ